jgi:hypothetical protein
MNRERRPGRRTLLLSATLVASAAGGCFPGPPGVYTGVVPATPPPPATDHVCNDTERADGVVVKCCVKVTRPDSQRVCAPEEQALPNRCCPE